MSVVPGMRRLLAALAAALLLGAGARAGAPLLVGEELVYNVSYSRVDIGQIRIRVVEKLRVNGRDTYVTQAFIDSYKGLPFVNLHAIYDDVIDQDGHATFFSCRLRDGDRTRSFTYEFDYPRHVLRLVEGIYGTDVVTRRDSLRLDTLTQDGLSLFFRARTLLGANRVVSLPVVVNEKKGEATIDFRTERTREEIDAVDYPVDVLHFSGEAAFVGLLGFTGGFEGWFSNDEARVPIAATMKVILGSIRIELLSWTRPGWVPPRAEGEG